MDGWPTNLLEDQLIFRIPNLIIKSFRIQTIQELIKQQKIRAAFGRVPTGLI